jgi:nucleoside-diphosphate-sugar epimerase
MSRIFLAGATGVIGQRLVPLLVDAGHTVAGMTRSADKVPLLTRIGSEPIVVDVFDRGALVAAVTEFEPDIILNELTDLPDDVNKIAEYGGLNARIRTEGNQNIIDAARASGCPKILAQSVAWELPDGPDARAVKQLESSVLAEDGVVQLRTVLRPGHLQREQHPCRSSCADRPCGRADGQPPGCAVRRRPHR